MATRSAVHLRFTALALVHRLIESKEYLPIGWFLTLGGRGMRAVYGFGDPIISADLSGEGLFSWLGDVWRSVGHSVLCHVGTATSILVAGACIIGTAGWCAGFMAAAFVGGVFQRGTNLGYANTVPQDIAAGITSVGVFGLVKVPAMIVRDAKLAMPLWQRAIYTAPSGVTPAANAAANYVAPQHGSCG